MNEADRLRASYEGILKNNPTNIEGVHYLAIWHLERQSFQQVCLFVLMKTTYVFYKYLPYCFCKGS